MNTVTEPKRFPFELPAGRLGQRRGEIDFSSGDDQEPKIILAVPIAPDGASAWMRESVSRRNQASILAYCQDCGAKARTPTKPKKHRQQTEFHHESDCRCSDKAIAKHLLETGEDPGDGSMLIWIFDAGQVFEWRADFKRWMDTPQP